MFFCKKKLAASCFLGKVRDPEGRVAPAPCFYPPATPLYNLVSMNKKFVPLRLLPWFLVVSASVVPAMGKIINLADQSFTKTSDGSTIAENTYVGTDPITGNPFTYHAGVVNGAVFRRAEASDDDNSGAGVFRNLYKSQDSPVEQGYNRGKVMDGSVLGGTSHLITKGDLQTDASGLFYIFTIDANEKNNAIERFISLDKFQLYVENDVNLGVDPDPLPTTSPGAAQNSGDLASLGALVYDMDAGPQGDSTVLMDYSTSNGSGTFDTFVFVQASLFDGYDDAAYIYLYTEFGGFTDTPTSFIADAGGEDIAAYTNFDGSNTPPELGVPPSIVPEPSSALLASLGALVLIFKRRRG